MKKIDDYMEVNPRWIYFTKLDNKLYYCLHGKNKCCVRENDKEHLIFNSSAGHNFTPFKIKDQYYAIGGQDNWKVDKKWRNLDYNGFRETYRNHFKREYIRGEEFYYDKIKPRFDDEEILKHCRGLYLFKSDDGIKFDEVQNDPVITAKHSGFLTSLSWKSADFDGKPHIVKYNGFYRIYIRANVQQDRRHIQTTTSKDLINWGTFQLVGLNYSAVIDNYYQCTMFKYNKILFGLFSYYNDKVSTIQLRASVDGVDFRHIDDLIKVRPFVVNDGKRKTRVQTVDAYEETKHSFIVYVHDNYRKLDSTIPSTIQRYEINKKYLDKVSNGIS